ncbi:MAG: hypothetical protein Q4B58_08255, partial [Bacteroidales bacterium]|nr:hypothetical protein [Bacteroidales bacterium]
AKKISEVFIYKCKEFFGQAEKAQANALLLLEHGFEEEAVHIFGYGESLIKEGIRQETKQFERILLPRIKAALAAGKNPNASKLIEMNEILKKAVNNEINLQQARDALQSAFGLSIPEAIEKIGHSIPSINDLL